MLQNILHLEGVSVLNKKQLKEINGNGCGYTYTVYGNNGSSITYTNYDDNLTLAQVKKYSENNMVNGADSAHYCCASCAGASWLSGLL